MNIPLGEDFYLHQQSKGVGRIYLTSKSDRADSIYPLDFGPAAVNLIK